MRDTKVAETIFKLEENRCRALVDNNIALLQELIADELLHVHTNGRTESRTEYFDTVTNRLEYLSVQRDDLSVRQYEQVVIASGTLRQRIRVKATDQQHEMNLFTTQVWVAESGSWRQSVFQATAIT
jgi:Domain of unknown function (DUF4440)